MPFLGAFGAARQMLRRALELNTTDHAVDWNHTITTALIGAEALPVSSQVILATRGSADAGTLCVPHVQGPFLVVAAIPSPARQAIA